MPSPTDKFKKTSNGGIPVVATVQAARSAGIFSLLVDTQQNWPTTTGVAFSTFKVDTNNKRVPNTQIDWVGVSNGTNTLSGMIRTGGIADNGNAIGDKVQMGPTAQYMEDVIEGMGVQHNPDGTHSNVTAITVTASGAIAGGSLSSGGAVTGASAAISGKGSFGLVQVTDGSTATVDGSGNITPANQVYRVTGLNAAATIKLPSITPYGSCVVVLQIYGAAAWGLTFDAGYQNVSGLDTPTTTTAGKWLTIGILYNNAVSKWQILSIEVEA
jgi:hypothetical protein